MTAIVWQRGFLREEYGVGEDEMNWRTGTLEPSEHTRPERVRFNLPSNVKPIAPGQCLSHMLRDGEIDAIYTAPQPSTYDKDQVVRLFPNFKEVEMDYFKRTNIHPIMHLVVIKREIYDAHPWVAKELMKAFAKSLDQAYEDLAERSALYFMLPWLEDNMDEIKAAMGDRYWGRRIRGQPTCHRQVLSVFVRAGSGQEAIPARRALRAQHAGDVCHLSATRGLS